MAVDFKARAQELPSRPALTHQTSWVSFNYRLLQARSSARLERYLDTVEVWGSSPHGPTILSLMGVVYILQSETTARFYIGSTADLPRRLDEHQRGHSPATLGRGPWKLVYQEEFSSLAEARRREAEIKRWKSAKLIHRLIAQSGG